MILDHTLCSHTLSNMFSYSEQYVLILWAICSQLLVHFLNFEDIFSDFLNFEHTLSNSLIFWHTFTTFYTLSQLLAHFLISWHTFSTFKTFTYCLNFSPCSPETGLKPVFYPIHQQRWRWSYLFLQFGKSLKRLWPIEVADISLKHHSTFLTAFWCLKSFNFKGNFRNRNVT